MKKYLTILAASLVVVACTTTQQRVAFNTIYSVEKAVSTSYSGYLDGVVHGKIATNAVPQLSQRYTQTQASITVALDAVQYNTNALAPVSLQVEASDFISLINALTVKKGL